MYFFPSSLVVFRICFLILIRVYLLYLSCSKGPSHSVWWSLFVWRFFGGLAVFSLWLFGDRRTHPRKRSMPRNSLHYFSISCLWGRSLSVLYYCSHTCMSIVCPPFFGSLYWGMLIYFLSWNLLDVAHSYLTCCGGCICCFLFSRFGHSCLHQWLTCCVSGCYALMRITHRRRWLVQFLH